MSELRKEYKLYQERRRRHVKSLIEEAVVNVLKEQEMQQQVAQQTADQQVPQADPGDPPPVTTPDTQVPKQYTVDDMIDELNAIRGGRSFTDPEVYGRLVTFFKGLEPEQKTNLDNLLSQIAELVTGVDDTQPGNQQQGQSGQSQPTPPPGGDAGAPQQSAPMPGAQQAAGAAGVGVA